MPHPYEDLVPLLRSDEPAAAVHVDVTPARSGSDLRRQATARRLEAEGAPIDDVAVLMRALAADPGVRGPVGLLAIARRGRLVVDQLEVGRPPVADSAEVCTVPDVTVAVRAREAELPIETAELDTGAPEDRVRSRRRRAIDVALTDDRVRGAVGLAAVVDALRAARVDTLLLRDGGEPEVRELLVLGAEPWLALSDADLLGVGETTRIPTRAALVRAAVLTGAQVLFPEPEDLPSDVAATLRWSEASA